MNNISFYKKSLSSLVILLFFLTLHQCVPPNTANGKGTKIKEREKRTTEVLDTTVSDKKSNTNSEQLQTSQNAKIPADTIIATILDKTIPDTINSLRLATDTLQQKDIISSMIDSIEIKTDTVAKKTLTFMETVNVSLDETGHYGGIRTYKGVKYDVFFFNLRRANMAFHWKNSKGRAYSNLGNLKKSLEAKGEKVLFETNGGIYASDYTPEGLYIENGKTLKKLNTRDGYGNFYMKPNGVFLIANNKEGTNSIASIVKTSDYLKQKKLLEGKGFEITYAVQSGPMLGINGVKHPKFNDGSPSKKIRNGVGVVNNKTIVFAIPQKPVNFFDFYSFFQEELHCNNSLYLDGVISKMYIDAPNAKRKDLGGGFVTIISVTEK